MNYRKKLFSLIILFLASFSLCGCSIFKKNVQINIGNISYCENDYFDLSKLKFSFTKNNLNVTKSFDELNSDTRNKFDLKIFKPGQYNRCINLNYPLLDEQGYWKIEVKFIYNLNSYSGTTSFSVKEGFKNANINKTSLDYTLKDYADLQGNKFDTCPSIGSPKVLVIPIWFSDSSTYISDTSKDKVINDINVAFNGEENSSLLGFESVKTYYSILSKNRLNFDFKISSWFDCNNSASYYSNDNSTLTRIRSLVNTASNWYFSNYTGENRSDYDLDKNGYLDSVILLYGAVDYITNPKFSSNMWAFSSSEINNSKNINSPTVNAFSWISFDFLYGNNALKEISSNSYSNSSGFYEDKIDTHTLIHETGHLLGLSDYYDYSSNRYYPAGGFSMQDANVGCHDPLSTLLLGWTDPYIPTDSCSIEIKPFQQYNDVILLSSNFNDFSSPFDEYFLVEFYTPDGLNECDTNTKYFAGKYVYPQGINNVGIRIWHVDCRLVTFKKIGNAVSDIEYYTYPVPNANFAFSNTYYDGTNALDTSLSPLGIDYSSYNILQIIKNDPNAGLTSSNFIKSDDLFYSGDIFNIDLFSNQFVNSNKLNSFADFKWNISFSINYSSDNKAVRIGCQLN